MSLNGKVRIGDLVAEHIIKSDDTMSTRVYMVSRMEKEPHFVNPFILVDVYILCNVKTNCTKRSYLDYDRYRAYEKLT
jgi:hypothetical protein